MAASADPAFGGVLHGVVTAAEQMRRNFRTVGLACTALGSTCAEKRPDRGDFRGGYVLRDLQIVIGAIHSAGTGLRRRYRDGLVTLLPHGGFHPAQMKVTPLALPFGVAGYLATLHKWS